MAKSTAAKKKKSTVVVELPPAPTISPELLRAVPAPWQLRGLQGRALQRTWEALNNPVNEYVVLEAPPGVGKSLLAITLARAYGPTAVLTSTVQLQEQYLSDFESSGLKVLKGRKNFRCSRAHDTCEVGARLNLGCTNKAEGSTCPYRLAKEEALGSPILNANYHSFWRHMGKAKGGEMDGEVGLAERRKLLVVDEAHRVEDTVMSLAELTVRLSDIPVTLPLLPTSATDPEPYYAWLDQVKDPMVKLKDQLHKEGNLDDEDKVDELLNRIAMVQHARRKQAATEPDTRTEYIVERGTMPDGKLDENWFALKPLHVRHLANRIWTGFPKVLFMSATILNAWEFCNALGLDPDKGEFVPVDESFPPENRPINLGALDMSYGARDESWPMMVNIIANLMKFHDTQKGLILTSSNVMMKHIMKELGKVDRTLQGRLIPAFGEDRLEKYHEHLRAKGPTVLLASGYWEGADLKDDASRFAIIPSLPRAMFTGQVKARAQLEPRWYRWSTLTKTLQGIGRSVRCFDYETEILTTSGWKDVHSLRVGDVAYGVPHETFTRPRPFRWGRLPVIPNRVHEINRPESPEATISIHTNAVDIVVTPDHQMLVQMAQVAQYPGTTTRNGKTYSWKQRHLKVTGGLTKLPARDLPARFKVPCAGWVLERPQTKLSPDWFWLMGFIIGDGNFSRTKSTVTIFQSMAPSQKKHVKVLKAVIARLGLAHKFYAVRPSGTCYGYQRNGKMGTWVFSGFDAARIRDVFDVGQTRRYSKRKKFRRATHLGGGGVKVDGWKRPEKTIPRWVLERAEPTMMLKLLEGMMAADGSTRGESRRTPTHHNGIYWTSDKDLADRLQEMLALCGYRSVISTHRPATADRKGQLSVALVNPATSDITRGTNVGPGPFTKVWCPSTQLGSVIARRNGRTFIAGNSETDEAVTYILDKEFGVEMGKKDSMIPNWVRIAVVQKKEGQ